MQQQFQALLKLRLLFETYVQHYHNQTGDTTVSLTQKEIYKSQDN